MDCRAGCGACCTAISISSPIPGMPNGKPAGIPCIHLTAGGLCGIFASPERPAICGSFQAAEYICGTTATEAFSLITQLEVMTSAG